MSKKQPAETDATRYDILEKQLTVLTEALKRERADAINLRRRMEAEKLGQSTYYTVQVVKKLLPVIDNFERSLKHVPEELKDTDYIKGIQGIVKQFEQVLVGLGVEKIKAVGQPFDPVLHEAVSSEIAGSGERETVSEELQAGYRIGSEVIRPAMVKVITK